MKQQAYPEYKESGVQWLGQVPKHWEIKRGRFIMRVNPPAPLLRNLKEDQEVSFVPMDAVNELGGIRLEQTRIKAEVSGGYTEFQDGDVVIAKITPCFENGKGSIATGLVNSAAYGTTELHVLRASQTLDYRFLFYLTITDGYRKLGESEMYGAGGQKRVPPDFCKDFLTPLPPLPEQVAIADFLNRETGRLDTLMAKKRQLIALLKEKRTALISRIVTRGLPEAETGLEPHTRFKNSGIEWLGQVPEGWDVKKVWIERVSRNIELQDGNHGEQHPKAEDYVGEGIPFVMANHIDNGKIDFNKCNYIEKEQADSLRIGFSNEGDVLLTHKGTIGRVGIVQKNHFPYVMLTPQVTYYRCLREIQNRFLFWLMQSKFWQDQLKLLAGLGSTRAYIGLLDQKTLSFLIPSEKEQFAIAAYLDRETSKLDRLVEKVDAVITRLQEYRTALITAAVTGKIDVREVEV